MIRLAAHNKRRRAWRSILLLLLPLLLLCLAGCDQAAQTATTLPRQMAGTWRTDEPKYEGRYMKLDGDRITFGLGGTASDRVEMVEQVTMTPLDNPTDFTVRLKMSDGGTDTIKLQYVDKFGGELHLKSQPKIAWSRKNLPPKKQQQVAEAPAPQPATAPLGTPKHETITRERMYGEHMTIYKIDCLKPNTCKSF